MNKGIIWALSAYAGKKPLNDRYLSPIYHADLSNLSPILIQAGNAEILVDDALRLFNRISNAELFSKSSEYQEKTDYTLNFSPKHRLELYNDLVHVFHTFPVFELRNEAFLRVKLWMRRILDKQQQQGSSLHPKFLESIVVEKTPKDIDCDNEDIELSMSLKCSNFSDITMGSNDIQKVCHVFSLISICKDGKVTEEKIAVDTMEHVTRGFP